MSEADELVRMANDIAANFAAYPEAEAIPSVAHHIRDFWSPRMRERFVVLVAAGGAGLDPLALAAGRVVVSEAQVAG